VVEQTTPKAVNSISTGANKWGVVDLIGNVWEWTSSELAAYPNSKYDIKKSNKNEHIIRGGSYNSKASGDTAVTSTTRVWVPADREDGLLGFRLVRSG
jgi:iron(II)-dependent oxidoreductase